MASVCGNTIDTEIIFYICKKCLGAIGILEDERFLPDIRLIFSSYQSSSLDGTRRNPANVEIDFLARANKALSPEGISGEELSVVGRSRWKFFAKDSTRTKETPTSYGLRYYGRWGFGATYFCSYISFLNESPREEQSPREADVFRS